MPRGIKKTQEQFIEQATKIHGDTIDFSKAIYLNDKEKVKLNCLTNPNHPEWEAKPTHLLRGSGCPRCAIEKITKTQQEFIQEITKIHGDTIDFSKAIYVSNKEKVKLNCLTNLAHPEWEAKPNGLLRGKGCRICAIEKITKTQQEFIEQATKIHGDTIDFSKAIYVSNKEKVKLNCLTNLAHPEWEAKPTHLLRGSGCPRCANSSISKASQRWLDHIRIPDIPGHTREVPIQIGDKIYKADGFDPQTNTIYEFHGDFYHGNPSKYKLDAINPKNKKTYGELLENTQKRSRLLKSLGYNVVSIWHSEWKKIEKELKKVKHEKRKTF